MRRAFEHPLAPALGCALLCVVYLLASPATADMAAHSYRAWLFEHEGLTVWNAQWYGGHHVLGYSLSVQKKNNLVTNPDPGTFAELSIAALGVTNEPTSLTITRFAKPKKDQPQLAEPVLTKDQTLEMVDLVRHVEVAYCRARPSYYPGGNCEFAPVDVDKPRALDLEFKFLKNGQWVCKQVREFAGK